MSDQIIEKCAAVLIKDRRLLVVRKAGTNVFISPGGKIDSGETKLNCLRRELMEELGVRLSKADFFGTFRRPSVFEENDVLIHTYLCEVTGEISVQAEIAEIAWISGSVSAAGIEIGTVFSEVVIPKLLHAELIDA